MNQRIDVATATIVLIGPGRGRLHGIFPTARKKAGLTVAVRGAGGTPEQTVRHDAGLAVWRVTSAEAGIYLGNW